LDKLYSITVDTSEKQVDSSAEKLIALAEGKTREAWTGVTFQKLKELLLRIVESKYFNTETATSATTTTTAKKPNAVAKGEESKKQYAKEPESSNATKVSFVVFSSNSLLINCSFFYF